MLEANPLHILNQLIPKPKDKEKNNLDVFNGKRPRNMDMVFATWNVRTMLQPGKMAEIAEQMNKFSIDAIALQETRWKGKGRIDKKDYTVLYSGSSERKGMYGTGFMISGRVRKSLLCYEPVNERLCRIRLKGKFRNITLISAYAPTEDSDDDVKLNFYQDLEEACQTAPRYDVKIILGDMNAQVGKEGFTRTVAGDYSLHNVTNENGKYLCHFAEANNMMIKSTCFPHKNIHKGSWKAPNGAITQIDHVLVNKRHSSSIMDVKTARGPDCDSDHYMVKIKLRERISSIRMGKRLGRKKWDLDKFKNTDALDKFKQAVDRKLAETVRDDNEDRNEVDRKWGRIKEVITQSAEEVIGEKSRQRNEEWFDEECLKALRERNERRQAVLQYPTRQSTIAYKESRRKAKRLLKNKKKKFLKSKIEQIEELRSNNETRKFYGAVRYLNRAFQPKIDTFKDKHGKVVESTQVVNRWKEHFNSLLGANGGVEETIFEKDNLVDDLKPLSIEDVSEAVEKLKRNKDPGEDMITAEFFKYGGEELLNQLFQLIEKIWKEESMPKEWTTSLICPLHKKGDKMLCENYRGISLLGVAYKIFSNIITKRLNEFTENILGDYQCGFRRGRGTADQVYTMRQTMEKCWEYNTVLHLLFVDYRRAFDSVIRENLFGALRDFNIPSKLIRLIKVSMYNSNAKVLINGFVSDCFPISVGVRQGDALSVALFNIALHSVTKQLNTAGNIACSSSQLCVCRRHLYNCKEYPLIGRGI